MESTRYTPLADRHTELGATMIDFGGWSMPVQYRDGIIQEHLATRRNAGLFDVSHMGRFQVSGSGALPLLQHVLSNNAAGLDIDEGHYTLIPTPEGGLLDDAYLYRIDADVFLLVVNAANREADWAHVSAEANAVDDVTLDDITDSLAMISLQGPRSRDILQTVLGPDQALPEPLRNMMGSARFGNFQIRMGRTGYTGEPLCFELFIGSDGVVAFWDALVEAGATPVGLGARDTLRLEAALPLYGHELGTDPDGNPIPAFASPLARFAVSLSPLKGDFIGRTAFTQQRDALEAVANRDYSRRDVLPQKVWPLALEGAGIARAGSRVYIGQRAVGWVTSGTMVPYWQFDGEGLESTMTDAHAKRAIGLALLDVDIWEGDRVEIDIRGRRVPAVVAPFLLRGEAPPFARPVLCYPRAEITATPASTAAATAAHDLIGRTAANTRWRQHDCINLIPSEMTPSALVRRLSAEDAVGRYAEHKPMKAFCDADVFYYQGTEFISRVEDEVRREISAYLGCSHVEPRAISGQMANTVIFSALVDWRNRCNRKSEQARIASVINHHIIKGGHLSAQPLGALRDFVARDPRTEQPAVVNFPVLADNPYRVDVAACSELIDTHRPELIIFGKSMILHPEPVTEIRNMVDDLGLRTFLMYDAAHVLGLLGPYFQQPLSDGAHAITGSTHKTFFGTQRGIVAANVPTVGPEVEWWEAIDRRAFPGSVSNHHLGTLVGLLAAAYEMNAFKDSYQKAVIANAKAFAMALADCGLDVMGDPDVSYTETHQVIVRIGYGKGPEAARRLEANNIIVNYQGLPDEEGFTAAGGIRMGVAEMTRFGMQPADFQELAQYLADVILSETTVSETVTRFRGRFQQMRYCFDDARTKTLVDTLTAMP